MDIEQVVKERNEALFSLDEAKIRAYAKKYVVKMPPDDTEFWAGVYKCIVAINDSPKDLKEQAYKWLEEHGFCKRMQ